MAALSFHLPADTRPLREEELVDDDGRLLKELVDRLHAVLADVQDTHPSSSSTSRMPWLTLDGRRTPRVVMIDGQRGTGKTSLMLTLLDRLQQRDSLPGWVSAIHGQVLATRPLDFDPLPPGMPLLAWILQAFGPVVEQVTRLGLEAGSTRLGELDRRAGRGELSLTGQWQRLHDHAVVAWREPSMSRGVPSHEEELRRVRTWGDFQREWTTFCDVLLDLLAGCSMVGPKGVILVPIDDVDLQITRAPELLRFVRLLHHHRVVFLLTGDARLLERVVQLDVDGQQRRLAHTDALDGQSQSAADDLGLQAVEKTILPAMRVRLSRLDLPRVWRWRGGLFPKWIRERVDEERRRRVDELAAEVTRDGPVWGTLVSTTHRRLESLAVELEAAPTGDEARKDALDRFLDAMWREAPASLRTQETPEVQEVLAGGLGAVMDVLALGSEGLVLDHVPERWPVAAVGTGDLRDAQLQVAGRLLPSRQGEDPRPLDLWLDLALRYLSDRTRRVRSAGVRQGAVVRSFDTRTGRAVHWPSPWFPTGGDADRNLQAKWSEQWVRWEGLLSETYRKSHSGEVQPGWQEVLCAWVRFQRGDRAGRGVAAKLGDVLGEEPDAGTAALPVDWKEALLALMHPAFSLPLDLRRQIVARWWQWQRTPDVGVAEPAEDTKNMLRFLAHLPMDDELRSTALNGGLSLERASLLALVGASRLLRDDLWNDPWCARSAQTALGPGAWALLVLGEMTDRRSTRKALVFHHGDDKREDISYALIGAERQGRWTGPSTWSLAGSAATELGAYAQSSDQWTLLAEVVRITRDSNGNASHFVKGVWDRLGEMTGKSARAIKGRVTVVGGGLLRVDAESCGASLVAAATVRSGELEVCGALDWSYPPIPGVIDKQRRLLGAWLGLASSVAAAQEAEGEKLKIQGPDWVLKTRDGEWPLPPLRTWVAWDRFKVALAQAHSTQQPRDPYDNMLWWVAWYLSVGAELAVDPWGPLPAFDPAGNMDSHWRDLRGIALFKHLRAAGTSKAPRSAVTDSLAQWLIEMQAPLKEALPAHAWDKVTVVLHQLANSTSPPSSTRD